MTKADEYATQLLTKPTEAEEAKAATPLGKTLLHVAWLAILLGLVIEAVILAVATVFDHWIEGKAVVADVVQKVSWSVIVCIGLALARGAARMAAMAEAALMGAGGLLAAPLAFAVARSLHEGVQEAMFIKVFQGGGGSPVVLALIKGLEYGVLGAALAWVGKQAWGKVAAHAGVGLACGIVFGALLLAVLMMGATQPLTAGAILSRSLNELIHPVGCALTLYAAEIMGRPGMPSTMSRAAE